jgi:hypothetical protein
MHRAFLTFFSAACLCLSLGLATPMAHAVCMQAGLSEFASPASTRPVLYTQASNASSAAASRDLTMVTGQVLGDTSTRRLVTTPRTATPVLKPGTPAEAMRVSTSPRLETARMDLSDAPPRSAAARVDEGSDAGWGYGPLIITIVLMLTIGVKRFRAGKP